MVREVRGYSFSFLIYNLQFIIYHSFVVKMKPISNDYVPPFTLSARAVSMVADIARHDSLPREASLRDAKILVYLFLPKDASLTGCCSPRRVRLASRKVKHLVHRKRHPVRDVAFGRKTTSASSHPVGMHLSVEKQSSPFSASHRDASLGRRNRQNPPPSRRDGTLGR